MEKAELELKWLEVKKKYSELIQKRLEMVVAGDFEGLKKQNAGCSDFFPEEKNLFKQSEVLRHKLMALNRKEYEADGFVWSKQLRKFKDIGDNGYFVCGCCKKLFKHKGCHNEARTLGNRDSFTSCEDHKDRIWDGVMEINKEALNELARN